MQNKTQRPDFTAMPVDNMLLVKADHSQSNEEVLRFVADGFALAENIQNTDGQQDDFRFGPVDLKVRWHGSRLREAFLPAIRHARLVGALQSGLQTRGWTIHVLDGALTGIPHPPAKWNLGEICYDHARRVHWSVPEDGIAIASDDSRGIWHIMDSHRKRLIYWVRDGADLPDWEFGAPFRICLHWTGLMYHCQMLHAAAIGKVSRAKQMTHGLLLTGIGGSGKSTTTLACALSGLSVVGDDFVQIVDSDAASTGLTAMPLYDTVKLTGMALETFRSAADLAVNSEREPSEKARVHIGDMDNIDFPQKIPVQAIASLTIGGQEKTLIRPATPVEVMMALVPSTIYLLRTGKRESFTQLGAIVRQLKTFHISLGQYPREAAQRIDAFLEEFACD